jgi:hypothetical protein
MPSWARSARSSPVNTLVTEPISKIVAPSGRSLVPVRTWPCPTRRCSPRARHPTTRPMRRPDRMVRSASSSTRLSPTASGGRLAPCISCTHAPAGSPRPWPRPAARSVVRPSSCNVIPSGCEHGKADYSNTSRLSRYGCVVAAASSGSGPLRTALAFPDGTATQDGSLNLMPSPLPQYPPAHAHVASGAGSPHGWSARPRAHTIPMTWTCRPCRPTGHGGRATP